MIVTNRILPGLLALVMLLGCSGNTRAGGSHELIETVESKAFRYLLGVWPEMVAQRPDTSRERKEREIAAFLDSSEAPVRQIGSYVSHLVWTLNSAAFRSEYYLVFLDYRPMDLVFAVIARDRHSGALQLLDDGSEFWLELKRKRIAATDYLAKDLVVYKRSAEEINQIAYDAITIADPHRPVVFLNSIWDVYQFSNALSGTWIRDLIDEDDSLQTLLSAPRLWNVGCNVYFQENFFHPQFDSLQFVGYQKAVKAPSFSTFGDGTRRAVIYTWSPDDGVLARWTVDIDSSLALRIKHELVAKGLGFKFTFL